MSKNIPNAVKDAAYWETVFTKPTVPRSDWEAFKWFFFEPTLLDNYSAELDKSTSRKQFLRIYFKFIIPLAVFLFLGSKLLIAYYNIPNLYPSIFRNEIIEFWQTTNNWWERFLFLVNYQFSILYVVLFLGLLVEITIGLDIDSIRNSNLNIRLFFALFSALFPALFFVLFPLLAYVLFYSLFLGLLGGLRGVSSLGFFFSLLFSLLAIFFLGYSSNVLYGFTGGLISSLFILIVSFLQSWVYPIHFIKSICVNATFDRNPFIYNEKMILPLLRVKQHLLNEAKAQPQIAKHFINFLLRYRNYQKAFALQLTHYATIASWKTNLRLEVDGFDFILSIFENIQKTYPKSYKNWFLKLESWLEELFLPNVLKHTPSVNWTEQLSEVRKTLISIEKNTALVVKLDLWETCAKQITALQQIHQLETFEEKHLYYEVFEHWQRIVQNEVEKIAAQAKENFVVPFNPYSKGNALTPERTRSAQLFAEREDLRDSIAQKILVAETLPTFLILGQRRTGKTSLLNFLPDLLGARFDVVRLDLEHHSGGTPSEILHLLRENIVQLFKETFRNEKLVPLPKDWLKAWEAFEGFLQKYIVPRERKLIIALDEYEQLHHILEADPTRGGHLLSRMRSFSQHQNKVIFLFIGAYHFADLKAPNWVKYFVHIHTFKVEYLSKNATMRLFTAPIPDFGLRYAEGVAEYLWEQTQGHPHLIHAIGSDLVDYANGKMRNPLEKEDVEKVFAASVLQREAQPFAVFWGEFCENENMKAIVRAIANGKNVDGASGHVRRLLEYGFIVPTTEGGYRMRVPLFERWVKLFDY